MKQPILDKGSKPEKNPTSYNNDGFGRDTYISYNNGGNFGTEFRFLTVNQNRTGMNMMPSPASRSSQVPQRIFYQCDGTGRDTYVLLNVQEKYSQEQTTHYNLLCKITRGCFEVLINSSPVPNTDMNYHHLPEKSSREPNNLKGVSSVGYHNQN